MAKLWLIAKVRLSCKKCLSVSNALAYPANASVESGKKFIKIAEQMSEENLARI
jgi:hypothetical protein